MWLGSVGDKEGDTAPECLGCSRYSMCAACSLMLQHTWPNRWPLASWGHIDQDLGMPMPLPCTDVESFECHGKGNVGTAAVTLCKFCARRDMEVGEIGAALRQPAAGRSIGACMDAFPALHLDAQLHPITRCPPQACSSVMHSWLTLK